jgi:hypothetical protein
MDVADDRPLNELESREPPLEQKMRVPWFFPGNGLPCAAKGRPIFERRRRSHSPLRKANEAGCYSWTSVAFCQTRFG